MRLEEAVAASPHGLARLPYIERDFHHVSYAKFIYAHNQDYHTWDLVWADTGGFIKPFPEREVDRFRARHDWLPVIRHLIAVMTCNKPEHVNKAMAQRHTWAHETFWVDVKFFVGQGVGGRMPDTIVLPVGDSYADIPRKVQEICRFAVARGYDYVTKVDDDVFVVPQRLRQLSLAPHDYVGTFCTPTGGFPAFYASGFCYHLSRKAAKVIADAEWNGDWMDERFVANTLAHHGIWGHHDSRNYLATNLPPSCLKQFSDLPATFFCEYNPQQLITMWESFGGLKPVPEMPLDPVPQVSVSAAQLVAQPTDRAHE